MTAPPNGDDREKKVRWHWAEIGFTVCGLVLAVIPLVLWMAWSPAALYTVLLSSFVAAAGAIAFYRFVPPPSLYARQEEQRRADRRRDRDLP